MGMKNRGVRPKQPVEVKAGQIYCVERTGKHNRYVRVLRIVGKRTHQPKVRLQEVTRTGHRKGRLDEVYLSWLHWNIEGNVWQLTLGYELQED